MLTTPRTNLPAELTSFVGRADAVAEVGRLLGDARLLSLTGPGGIGKTRIALRAAEAALGTRADGVWLVELASIADPGLLPQTVAESLALEELGPVPTTEAVCRALRPKQLLLVLDNCEHLVAGCANFVAAALRAAPGVSVLATSREPLRVEGEVVWRVPPLPVPDDAPPSADAAASDAVRLFADRARAVRPGFGADGRAVAPVARICRLLDGLPLAIELAAARADVLSPAEIADGLDSRFALLTAVRRGGSPRHRTLRAMVDWSYGLLDDDERLLFEKLSVFVGGWTREAASAVAADGSDVLPVLGRLVDKSLATVDATAEPTRYGMLETLRAYGRERLAERGAAADTERAHARCVMDASERAAAQLFGRDQAAVLARLDRDRDNVRAALRWGVGHEPETALRIAAAVWRYWLVRGRWEEGRSWLDGAHAACPSGVRDRERNTAAIASALFAAHQGDLDAAWGRIRTVDRAALDAGSEVRLLGVLGPLAAMSGDGAGEAEATARLAALEEDVDPVDRAWARGTRAMLLLRRLALLEARDLLDDAVAALREAGDWYGLAYWSISLADTARAQADDAAALALYDESLAGFARLGVRRGWPSVVRGQAAIARRGGDLPRALRL